MGYKVVINNNNEYNLINNWSAREFEDSLTLMIGLPTLDLSGVISDFSAIEQLSIYKDDVIVATYTSLNSFSNVSFCDDFVDDDLYTIRITLTRLNIVDQVKRLDEKINPVIDVEHMTLEEYKEFQILQVQSAVQQDIFAGKSIELSNGESEYFEFTLEDQSNISNLYMAIISGNGAITSLPFHSHGNYCRQYSAYDLIIIYAEMQKFITEKTTIANFTIQKIREAESKEEVAAMYYGMEFDAETTAQIEEILLSTMAVIDNILNNITPND